jgi:hypothetical protein
VTIHRYYTSLNSYKKTCKLDREPSKKYLSRQHVTIVEYSAICPRGSVPHGNAKQTSQEYVRTDPKIIEEIRDRLNQKQSCSDICKDLAFNDLDSAPHDHQQCWFSKTLEQRERLFQKLLNDHTPLVTAVKSTCSDVEVPKPQKLVKKPHQNIRPRTNRTQPRYFKSNQIKSNQIMYWIKHS